MIKLFLNRSHLHLGLSQRVDCLNLFKTVNDRMITVRYVAKPETAYNLLSTRYCIAARGVVAICF